MKVIVIGAGASGLMAAIEASKNGHSVRVLELKEEAAKKIYATGNGRCNITNEILSPDCYHSDDMEKLSYILKDHDTNWLKEYMENIGLYTTNIGDYVYPLTKQAQTVVNILVTQCRNLGVEFVYNCNVKDIAPVENGAKGFLVRCNVMNNKNISKEEFDCDRVVVTCGGKAAPKLGSDGSGYYLMSKLGHTINDVVPALVPLVCDDGHNGKILNIMQKVRSNSKITAYINESMNNSKGECFGELQLADYGISGIVTFQLSGVIADAINKGQNVYILVDFLPEYHESKLTDIISNIIKDYDVANMYSALTKALSHILNDKIAEALVKDIELSSKDLKLNELCEYINEAISRIKRYRLDVVTTKGFDMAQVCRGGVSFKEVNMNMQSKIVDNLYIAGELLDVDGICGGYNLHFAFVSGILAGRAI